MKVFNGNQRECNYSAALYQDTVTHRREVGNYDQLPPVTTFKFKSRSIKTQELQQQSITGGCPRSLKRSTTQWPAIVDMVIPAQYTERPLTSFCS